MTLALLRRDFALRALPKWLAISLANVLLFSGIRAYHYADREIEQVSHATDLILLVLSVWLPLSIFLVYVGSLPRYRSLDLTLPVAAHRLWLVHLLAIVVAGTIILILATTVLTLQVWGFERWYGEKGPMSGPDIAGLLPQFVTGLILAAVFLQSRQITKQRLLWSGSYFVVSMVGLVGLLGLLVLLCAQPLGLTVLTLGFALALGSWSYRALPPAIELATAVDSAVPAGELRRDTGLEFVSTDSSRPGLSFRTIWITFYGHPKLWALLFFSVFLGSLYHGTLFGLLDVSEMTYLYIPLGWYFFVAIVSLAVTNLCLLDPLPFTRRQLFAFLALPILVCMGLGYVADSLSENYFGLKSELVRFEKLPWAQEENGIHYVMVPWENFEIAWDGSVPLTTSPWGETQAVYSEPLIKGSRARLYKQFTTDENSSLDFVAWQIGRAAFTVYGQEVPWEQIRDRYLTIDSQGRVVPVAGGMTLRADRPGLEPVGKGRMFPVVMLFIGFPGWLLMALNLRSYRSGVSQAKQKAVRIVSMVGAMALYLAFILGAVLDLWEPGTVIGFWKILARHITAAFPGDQIVLWLSCLLLLGVAYRLAESQFVRIEAPLREREEAP